MAKTMRLEIVSAEQALFSGDVQHLIVTGKSGELGIHPGHTALLTALKPGQIQLTLENGEHDVFYMSGGFLEVQPDVATILADSCIRAEDLDEASAKSAIRQAEKAIEDRSSHIKYSTAVQELAEAMAQLKTIQMLRDKFK